ncbi:glycosyltransferase [Allonocardiopsis opalescens]|uniref:UDP-N-acetylglucosamine transferase subunit ALG13 n=1 Tax=Allonocardiopsis opalescens TaxID=1144618 RepID=A0A2T0QD13_9ACTN|nr:glycosyltransferase [Allonocardiopsis opalescens]PRY01844.1 UDP-N-acetylglucosamine transferase subunit ALG13 [Allonocardiopsis opalescens]
MSPRPLVLVTVGTDFHPFRRLAAWADRIAERHPGIDVLVQHGSAPPPRHARGRAYLDHAELRAAMEQAAAVVCHGGPATITEARRAGRLPIVVPRDPRRGEHVDDHQLRFVARMSAEGLVHACDGEEELRAAVDKALTSPADFRAEPPAAGAGPRDAAERAGRLIDTLVATRRPAPPPATAPAPAAPAGRRPDVTVVIPTRDRPRLLRDALDSVWAQDYPGGVHCLVVHDQCAPDPSLAARGGSPPRSTSVLVNARTPGLAGARNTGLLAAATELVAFCDDDDLWLPGKLRRQVGVLAADPDAQLVCCGIRIRYGDTTAERSLDTAQVTLAELLRSRLTELHPSTFLLRTSAVRGGVGLVAEDIPGSYAEDYEFLLRAARQAPVRNVPEIGVQVRWHARSYFSGRWETVSGALRWLLDRHPELRLQRRGLARVTGQIAFAEAARGERREALRWVGRTLRTRPAEARAHLALAVLCGLSPDAVLRALHRRGRGV